MADLNDLLTIHTFSVRSYTFFLFPPVSFSYALQTKQAFSKGHHNAVFRRQQVVEYKSQHIHCKYDWLE